MRKIVFLILSSFSFIFGMKQHKVSALDDIPQYLLNIVLQLKSQPSQKLKIGILQIDKKVSCKVLSLENSYDCDIIESFAKNARYYQKSYEDEWRIERVYNNQLKNCIALRYIEKYKRVCEEKMLVSYNKIVKILQKNRWSQFTLGHPILKENSFSPLRKFSEDRYYFFIKIKSIKSDEQELLFDEQDLIYQLCQKFGLNIDSDNPKIECDNAWTICDRESSISKQIPVVFADLMYLSIKKDALQEFQQKMNFNLGMRKKCKKCKLTQSKSDEEYSLDSILIAFSSMPRRKRKIFVNRNKRLLCSCKN